MRRAMIFALAAALITPVVALADDPEPPIPETGFLTGGNPVLKSSCTRLMPGQYYGQEPPPETWDPYGDKCVRLKFKLGPIVVQPGANSTYPYVVNIEKPAYSGYMTRIKPDLVMADGTPPPVDDIHIHHATWLGGSTVQNNSYGHGPFFASGEEKTIAEFPYGYGMRILNSDYWYMVHMIHGATPVPRTVWLTYDIDYVAVDDAATLEIDNPMTGESWTGIRQIRAFWLDVWKNGRRSNYPVFNMERGYGQEITDPVTRSLLKKPDSDELWTSRECAWPDQKCAKIDSFGSLDVGQGRDGNAKGTDILIENSMSGTLVGIGGHLHPGGLRVEVDQVRCLNAGSEEVAASAGSGISSWSGRGCPTDTTEDSRRIFTSDAIYFERDQGRPYSWDFSMTVAGNPWWKVAAPAGRMFRIRAIHETERSSWYEGMGIAVAYLWSGDEGIDPFAPDTVIVDDETAATCRQRIDLTNMNPFPRNLDGDPIICTRGNITHGPLPEAGNVGDYGASNWEPGSLLDALPPVDTIHMGGFAYVPGNQSTWNLGVPSVRKDESLTFVNEDAGLNIWHTVTACAFPCNGAYTLSYPRADFGIGEPGLVEDERFIQWDSANVGITPDPLGIGAGRCRPGDSDSPAARDCTSIWSMVPSEYGFEAGDIGTYFCRIHPGMRGAFRVID